MPTLRRNPRPRSRVIRNLQRVDAYEARIARDRPVAIETLSPVAIDQLTAMDAETWLDRRIAGEEAEPVRDAGFGRDVRQAELQRRQWLVEQDLAEEKAGTVRVRADALDVLRQREVQRVAGQLSSELGLAFVETQPGHRIEGTLVRRIDTLSGQLAVVGKSKEFTLVPWQPVLEKRLGKPISGIMREAGASWTFGRERGPNL